MNTGKSALCLLPLLLLLTGASGWLWQWPINPAEDGHEAYRLELDEAVYRHARHASLRDVAVIDAEGQHVPSMLFAAGEPGSQAQDKQPLRWFVLPKADSGAATLDTVSERDEHGRLLSIKTREIKQPNAPGESWLVDASQLAEKPEALWLRFAPEVQFSGGMRVEGSDDLRTWKTLHGHIAVLQLAQGDERITQNRIPLEVRSRYLRLTLLGAEAPLQAVLAELPAVQTEARREWQRFQGKASQDRRSFEFEVDGRQPFDRVEVILPGSSVARFRLESRDDPQQPWRYRAGPWMQYQLGDAGSEAQAIGPVRQRYWRLVSESPVRETPELKLGWRPEVLVFVATGKRPYRLVAGSATQERQEAPLPELFAQIRKKHGSDWRPGAAQVMGEGGQLDATALDVPRNYKHWLLWGILILAVLLVGSFALSLLKGGKAHE